MLDIDGSPGANHDVIGEVEVTMGKLMGAPKQTFNANLTYQNKANRGQLIVRTQAIQQTNMVAKWALRLQNLSNMGGGCLGMCAERQFYRT